LFFHCFGASGNKDRHDFDAPCSLKSLVRRSSGCNIGDKVPFSGIDPVWKFANQPYLQPGVSSKNMLEDSMNNAKKKKRKNNGKPQLPETIV